MNKSHLEWQNKVKDENRYVMVNALNEVIGFFTSKTEAKKWRTTFRKSYESCRIYKECREDF